MDGVTAICSVGIVIVAIVSMGAIGYAITSNDSAESGVYSDLDQYGGTVRLDEATGSGAMSLESWYVPQESDVKVTGGYIHIDKAKSYAYSSVTYEVYIPMQAVAYVIINNH